MGRWIWRWILTRVLTKKLKREKSEKYASIKRVCINKRNVIESFTECSATRKSNHHVWSLAHAAVYGEVKTRLRSLCRHSWFCVPSCALEKVPRGTSSLVETSARRSANFIVVCVVGSPRLHPCSLFEAAAFLSESSNRVIITGRYLGHGSDPVGLEAKKYSDAHRVSAI